MTPKEKVWVEMGPLLVLAGAFLVSKFGFGSDDGLIHATGAFIIANLLAIRYSYEVEGKVAPVALVTTILVTGLGGLTILLKDETFIKQKPTYVSGFIGSVLLIGLAFGRPLVKLLMQGAIQMEDAGWRKLTLRWGLFMLLLAGLNEVVWRNFSTETWLSYKLFGIVPLTIAFLVLQGPLISEYGLEPAKEGEPPPDGPAEEFPAEKTAGRENQNETTGS